VWVFSRTHRFDEKREKLWSERERAVSRRRKDEIGRESLYRIVTSVSRRCTKKVKVACIWDDKVFEYHILYLLWFFFGSFATAIIVSA
jgi:hypothetical protein